MEDKRTRRDYIIEIEQLKRVNRHYEKSYKELNKFIDDEINNTDDRIKNGYKFLGNTKGAYTLEQNLIFYKNALIKASKKIDELERC